MRVGRVLTIALAFVRRQGREPVGVFFMVFAPLMLAFVFGLGDKRANDSVPIAIVREDDGPLARDLAELIDDRPELRVRNFDSRADVEDAIRRSDVYAGVVIGRDYDERALSTTGEPIEVIGNQSSSAFTAASAAIALVVDRENQALTMARELDLDVDDARERAGGPPVEVVRITAHETKRATGLGRATAGMLIYFVFDTSMFHCSALLAERRLGVVARMTTTATRNSEIVAGEILGRLMMAVVQIALVIPAGILLFGVRWGDPFGVVAIAVSFAIVSTGIGVAIGCRANTELSLFARTGLAAVAALLGGCFFALSVVPDWLRIAGHVTPHAWAVDGLSRMVSTDAGVGAIATPLIVLMSASVVVTALVVVRFQRALVR
ncbi:MAG: ABC transporter permease [Actinomycetota bacterium]